MKTGDEAANLNINMTPNPETELKPKDSQSADKVIVHGMSHMHCTLRLLYQIKFLLSFLAITLMRSNIYIILIMLCFRLRIESIKTQAIHTFQQGFSS